MPPKNHTRFVLPLSKSEFAAVAEGDFLFFDGLEACEFYSRSETEADGFADAVSFTGLQRRGTLEDEAFISGIAAGKAAVIFHGLVSEIGDGAKVRDLIIDSDERTWIIWKVETQTFNSRYRFTCVESHESIR